MKKNQSKRFRDRRSRSSRSSEEQLKEKRSRHGQRSRDNDNRQNDKIQRRWHPKVNSKHSYKESNESHSKASRNTFKINHQYYESRDKSKITKCQGFQREGKRQNEKFRSSNSSSSQKKGQRRQKYEYEQKKERQFQTEKFKKQMKMNDGVINQRYKPVKEIQHTNFIRNEKKFNSNFKPSSSSKPYEKLNKRQCIEKQFTPSQSKPKLQKIITNPKIGNFPLPNQNKQSEVINESTEFKNDKIADQSYKKIEDSIIYPIKQHGGQNHHLKSKYNSNDELNQKKMMKEFDYQNKIQQPIIQNENDNILNQKKISQLPDLIQRKFKFTITQQISIKKQNSLENSIVLIKQKASKFDQSIEEGLKNLTINLPKSNFILLDTFRNMNKFQAQTIDPNWLKQIKDDLINLSTFKEDVINDKQEQNKEYSKMQEQQQNEIITFHQKKDINHEDQLNLSNQQTKKNNLSISCLWAETQITETEFKLKRSLDNNLKQILYLSELGRKLCFID